MSIQQDSSFSSAAALKPSSPLMPKSEGNLLGEGHIIGNGGNNNGNSNNNNNKKSRNSSSNKGGGGGPIGDLSQESDSFYKYYNKEIKVNQEEIPIVLYELVDAAYNYIQRESYEKGLILLQKTENVLEVVSLESSKRDKYIAFTTFHNMAMCYQKLGMLEECYIYLKECLTILTAPQPQGQLFYKFSNENCVAARMKQLKQECKLKLQLCAIMSQTQNHTEALDNAKKSVRLIHQLFKDLSTLCGLYIKKIEKKDIKKRREESLDSSLLKGHEEEKQISVASDNDQDSNHFLEDSISMMERTSLKLYPVVKEVLKRMIDESGNGHKKEGELQKGEDNYLTQLAGADMRSVLGFLNQNEWVYQLNIGNIMQLQPISLKNDMLSQCRNECELSRDSFLEKIALLSVSYFCVSTEMRFILQSREQYLSSPIKRQRELESEYWHAKSLEIACSFLPSECPLLNHILLSYQKHHDPSAQPIREDQEQNDVLSVIRPLPGIESNKYQPIVRQLSNVKVAITPCQISPLTSTKIFFRKKPQRVLPMFSQETVSGKSSAPGGVLPQANNQVLSELLNQVSQTNSAGKQGNDIVLLDQQALLPPLDHQHSQGGSSTNKANQRQQQQQPLLVSNQQYSDDYYDNFVRKMFDDNPQLDKKHLVTKILSHLQSQDYSFLQRQINDQEVLSGDDPRPREQRQTLIQFDEEGEDIGGGAGFHSQIVDVDDIMLVNKSFDVIQQLKHEKPYAKKKLQVHKEQIMNEDEDQESPGASHHAWSNHQQQQILHQKNSKKGGGKQSAGGVGPSMIAKVISSSNGTSSGSSTSKNGRYSSQHNQILRQKTSSSQQQQKKKSNRGIQKLMSYLEGDSLLKEIERSLENHNTNAIKEDRSRLLLEDELLDQDEEGEGDNQFNQKEIDEELNMVASGLDKEQYSYDEDVEIRTAGGEEGNAQDHQLQASMELGHLNSTSENMEESPHLDSQAQPSKAQKQHQEVWLRQKVQHTALNNKSRSSNTRPSSSITNQTSVGVGQVRRQHPQSSSFLNSHQRNARQQRDVKQQMITQSSSQQRRSKRLQSSQQKRQGTSGSPALSESLSSGKESLKYVNSEGRQVTSITVGLSSNSKKNNLQRPKSQTKTLPHMLKSNPGANTSSAQKALRTKQYQQQRALQLSAGGCSRKASKSRSSNHSHHHHHQHHHFKSVNLMNTSHQNKLSQKQLLVKDVGRGQRRKGAQQPDQRSSEDEGGRSSSIKQRSTGFHSKPSNKRDNSAETTTHHHQNPNPEAFSGFQGPTKGGPGQYGPDANLSFDLKLQKKGSSSGIDRSQIQKQVLQNQKYLMMQQMQMQQKAQGKKYGPATLSSMDNTKKNLHHSRKNKSTTAAGGAAKRISCGSMSTTAGIFKNNHQQSIDHHQMSRQSVNYVTSHHQRSLNQQIGSNHQQNNKENLNLLSKAAVNLMSQQSMQTQQQGKRNHQGVGMGLGAQNTSSSTSCIKKKSIRELTSGLLAHQKSYSREVHHHPHNSRTRVGGGQQELLKNQLLDHSSPQLIRKQKKKAGSHSPPKKQVGVAASKFSQKTTGELKNLVQALSSSKGNQSKHQLQIPQQEGRSRAQTAGSVMRKVQTNVVNQHHIQSASFIQDDDINQQHSQSWWLLPENNQSFDGFGSNSGGGIGGAQRIFDDCLSISTTGAPGGTHLQVKKVGGKAASTLIDNQGYRPSFGAGPVFRGSSDVIQFQSNKIIPPPKHQLSLDQSSSIREQNAIAAAAALLNQMRSNGNNNSLTSFTGGAVAPLHQSSVQQPQRAQIQQQNFQSGSSSQQQRSYNKNVKATSVAHNTADQVNRRINNLRV